MTDRVKRYRLGPAVALILLSLAVVAPVGAAAASGGRAGSRSATGPATAAGSRSATGPATAAGTSEANRLIQPAAWSSPTRVATGVYGFVSDVVDSTGHTIIAATGHGGLWYITDRSGLWKKTRILTDLPNRSYREVSVALDPNDRVYIAVERSSCDDCAPGSSDGIFLVTDKGRTGGTFPSTPTKIAPAGSGEPSLKVSHGHPFLAMVKPCCMPGPLPPVFLRTNATGTWTQARVADHGDAPALRIGSDGRPRIAFTKPSGIAYAVAGSVTGSFSVSTVPGTAAFDNLVGLALDAHDRPQVVWVDDSGATRAVYDWRTASGWHAAETIGALGDAFAVSFDVDSLGRPNVAAGGSKVRAFVRVSGSWVGTTITTSADVTSLALRRAFNGHVVVAYANFAGGVFVSTN